MNQYDQKKIVCYSAGCLVVIGTFIQQQQQQYANTTYFDDDDEDYDENTTTSNNTNTKNNNKQQLEVLYAIARSVQIEYEEGRIHRYQVCELFIDWLLLEVFETETASTSVSASESAFLDFIRNNLYILTTAATATPALSSPSSLLPTAIMEQPTDRTSLRRLLVQTSWIPYVTGSSWTYKGRMDGVFSMGSHPPCAIQLGNYNIRDQPTIKANMLNMNLSQRNVQEFWSLGLNYDYNKQL